MPENSVPVPQTEVDERGISWQNKAKEYERKYQEQLERYQQREQELERLANEDEQNKPTPVESTEAKTKRLQEFVNAGPDEFMDRKIQEFEYKRQLSEARDWLFGQKDFKPGDNDEVLRMVARYSIGGMPMSQVRNAWELLQRERTSMNNDTSRENRISQSSTEGSGKPAPMPNGNKSREELVKDLGDNIRKHGYMSREAIDSQIALDNSH